MAKERIVYLDLTKFAAIALVCISHCYFLTDINNPVYRIISSFYMPLFMLMCGFFSTSSFQLDLKEFLKKKSVQLMLPAVSCSILSCLILTVFGKPLLNWMELYGGVWFLKTLFACYLTVFLFKKVFPDERIACFMSSFLMILFPFGYSLMFNYMLLFFWTGLFLRKHYDIFLKYIDAISIVSGIFFVLACFTGNAKPQFPFKSITVIEQPLMCMIQYFVALAGSLFVMGACYFISNWLEKSHLVVYLSKIGQYTLGIYIVQTIILERLFLNIIHFDSDKLLLNYLVIPFLGLFFCFISYQLVLYFKNNRIIRLLLFGNQYK